MIDKYVRCIRSASMELCEQAGQYGLYIQDRNMRQLDNKYTKLEPLLPKHGGYRELKSYQLAQLVYDITVRFCDRYISKFSRTWDKQ